MSWDELRNAVECGRTVTERVYAVRACALRDDHVNDAAETIVRCVCDDQNQTVQCMALRALAYLLSGDPALPSLLLMAAVMRPEPVVRTTAKSLLAGIRRHRGYRVDGNALAQRVLLGRRRLGTVRIIDLINAWPECPDSIGFVVERLELDSDAGVRLAAAIRLAQMDIEALDLRIPLLRAATNDHDLDVRRLCLDALRKVWPDDPTLESLEGSLEGLP